jgi:hypothetical protein
VARKLVADFAIPSGEVRNRAAIGETVTALPAGLLGRIDYHHFLDVLMHSGALYSVSEEALLQGANFVAVGTAATGYEILQFRTAELVGPSTYRLKGLLRAQAGSQQEMLLTRDPGASLVVLNAAVIQPKLTEAEALRPSTWRIGPRLHDILSGTYQEFELGPILKPLRPLAPVQPRAHKIAGGVALSWIRQTRVDGDGWETDDVPLAEASESYRLEILDGAAVKRTIALPTPTYTYTDAQMTTDFGAPQSAISIRVLQISAAVGAGTALERTLYV